MDGDEEEEGVDDLENEFNLTEASKQDKEHVTDAMLHGHMSYGGTYDRDLPHHMMHVQPQFPLLTNGQVVWPPVIPSCEASCTSSNTCCPVYLIALFVAIQRRSISQF